MRGRKESIILLIIMLFTSLVFISCGEANNKTHEEKIDFIEETNNLDETNKEASKEENIMEEEIHQDQVVQGKGSDLTTITIRDISSIDIVKELEIGWNLGNTLDATGGALLNTEMSWGNPTTREEMIIAVKEAGFNIIRIPVSWGSHLGPEPDYNIHTIWLDRVNEVVDYAIDNDLYVILNMHHEEWHFPSYDNHEKAETILVKVWTQIAERFKDYDEHLIFEGMNEPRMKDTPFEWNGGTVEARDVINQLNSSFVETIRNSGGNNSYRHLMIPTYAASSDPKTWKDFIRPNDDKIIVSIHAYTPYNFALNKSGTSEWSRENPQDTREIDSLMDNLYDWFISKGHPVILGEFGAMDKDNLEARVDWAEYYVKKANEKGIPCIWWDNGAFIGSGELFGLLDRRKGEWKQPEMIEALMSGLE